MVTAEHVSHGDFDKNSTVRGSVPSLRSNFDRSRTSYRPHRRPMPGSQALIRCLYEQLIFTKRSIKSWYMLSVLCTADSSGAHRLASVLIRRGH